MEYVATAFNPDVLIMLLSESTCFISTVSLVLFLYSQYSKQKSHSMQTYCFVFSSSIGPGFQIDNYKTPVIVKITKKKRVSPVCD